MYNFIHLTTEIRALMVLELEKDKSDGAYYLSQNFNETGDKMCYDIAKNEVLNGNERTFVDALISNKCFGSKSKTGKTVPRNAAELYAHNEFNRIYMRAVCLHAVQNNLVLTVYRAKHSEIPREESELLIGKQIDPNALLADLRRDAFIEKAFGLSKPNSGLSVRIAEVSL